MAHALAADAAVRHLDAAAVADHALVLHAAVLAAGAFPVLFGAKNAFAEQAVFFRPVRAVVDRLGLFHLAERPRTNVVRSRQADFYRGVVINPVVTGFADCHICGPWGEGQDSKSKFETRNSKHETNSKHKTQITSRTKLF